MRRLLTLILLLLPTMALARQSAQGDCVLGGRVVVTNGLNSTTKVLASYPSCTVTVSIQGGGLATIYSDNNGTVLANPFTATTGGHWQWYADNGHYSVLISGGTPQAMPSSFTYSDIVLNDSAQQSTSVCGLAFSSNITFTASSCSDFTLTLTGNVTSSAVSGAVTGQQIIVSACQDGTGSRTLAWPPNFSRPPTIASAANACTNAAFFYDGSNWRNIGATGDTLVPSGGGISGTWSGSPIWTGLHTFSGGGVMNGTWSGSPTWTGALISQGGSLQGTWTAGPTYGLLNSPSGLVEVGNIVTATTLTTCTAVAGAAITISGTASAYDGGYKALTDCAGTNHFTFFHPTSGLAASGGGTVILSPVFTHGITHPGPESITGPLFETNVNGMCVAGPGPTPTIDQAVTLCGSGTQFAAMVEISPYYTGPESINLFTMSTGYKAYNGPNNISICDYRANSVFATAPIYPCVIGGRIAGQLNRMGVMYYAHSPADSATGVTSFNLFDGTAPSNDGLQAGSINVVMLHDTVTIGNSLTEYVGTDSEAHLDATSADNPVYSTSSYAGAVLISRSGVNQNVLEASVFRAKSSNNQSPGTAKIFYSYGANLDAQTGGTYRNFSLHSRGDFLFENGVKLWAASADTAATISTATEVGQTATFTMTTTCAANPTLIAGAQIGVSGVSVAGYNNQWIINSSGCSGSSFSVFAEGTSGLAAGVGGTVQSTTPRVITNFRSDNVIVHTPLANASGWRWQTQAAADLFVINSGVVQSGVNFAPLTAGAQGLGAPTLPWGFLRIGLTANDYLFNPIAPAAARQVNLPDSGGTANMGLNLNATNGVYESKRTVAGCTTGAVAGNVCSTTVTWGTAFADANYTATCQGNAVTSGAPVLSAITSKVAASIAVNTMAVTAAAAQFTNIECTAVHD